MKMQTSLLGIIPLSSTGKVRVSPNGISKGMNKGQVIVMTGGEVYLGVTARVF